MRFKKAEDLTSELPSGIFTHVAVGDADFDALHAEFPDSDIVWVNCDPDVAKIMDGATNDETWQSVKPEDLSGRPASYTAALVSRDIWGKLDQKGLVEHISGQQCGIAPIGHNRLFDDFLIRPSVGAAHRPGKRVFFYAKHDFNCGALNILHQLCDRLVDFGISASVVTSEVVEDLGYEVKPMLVPNYRLLGRKFRRTLNAEKASFIFTHMFDAKVASEVRRYNPGIKIGSFIQGREDIYDDESECQFKDMALLKSFSDGVCVSSFLKNSVGLENHEVIPCGVDTSIFNPGPSRSWGRKKIKVLAQWCHETSHRRGADNLRELYRRLSSEDVELILFGKKTDNMPSHSKHFGWLSKSGLADAMRDCDIFVEPANLHGFGLPALEAMACGACVVSIDNGGVREYYEDGTMILANDLYDSCKTLISNPSEIRKVGKRAAEHAGKFTIERMVEDWASLIHHMY